jgi:hypothetical protein
MIKRLCETHSYHTDAGKSTGSKQKGDTFSLERVYSGLR